MATKKTTESTKESKVTKKAKSKTAEVVEEIVEQATPEIAEGLAAEGTNDQSTPEEQPTETSTEDLPNKTKNQQLKQKQARSTRYIDLRSKINKEQEYAPAEAVATIKETANTKFAGSIEVHMNVNQKGLRGFVTLPHATGQKKQILAFGLSKNIEGVTIADDKAIDQIASGELTPGKHFDIIIATPAYMPKLAKVAKILGPRGLMPNPKSGTVTDNPEKAINDLQGGQMEYKTEANSPIIHTVIGKSTVENEKLAENLTTLISTIGASKIRSVYINATMGPSVRVKVS